MRRKETEEEEEMVKRRELKCNCNKKGENIILLTVESEEKGSRTKE